MTRISRIAGIPALVAALACFGGCGAEKVSGVALWENIPDYSGIPHGSTMNADNTGVPDGHTLTNVSASITVTESWIDSQNGGSRVLENRNFVSGAGLSIEVSDFTVRYCKFNGEGGIYLGKPVANVLIQDCELDGDQENLGAKQAVKNSAAGVRLLRLNIHHWPRALTVVKGKTIVENCYLHDLTSDNSGEHIENIYVAGGEYQLYVGNWIEANPVSITPTQDDFAVSAALAIYNQGGGYEDLNRILVERNYFDGVGSFAFYGGAVASKDGPYATNTVVRGNVFGREHRRFGGEFGPVTAFSVKETGNAWSGNTWGPRGPHWVSGDPEQGDPVTLP